MKHLKSFEPKWTTPPGATVLDLIQERGLPIRDLATATNRDMRSVSRLLFGLEPLTKEWADSLSSFFGATPSFWLRREELYRADLERLCEVGRGPNIGQWLKGIPLQDMVRFGWIEQGASAEETVLNACAFFGVTSAEAFGRKYRDLLAASAYRTSSTFEARPSAVAAWLRQGEIEASAIDCEPWSEQKLQRSLADVRALTRESDPKRFLPELERLLAECGVAMVVARAPNGCRASGATRFLRADKALIQLSFRYLADDQFWFTVFHEIGHLVLHAHDTLFLEGLEARNSNAEAEANDFALNTLFSQVGVDALDTVRTSKLDIARLARRAGISPGIVVGQLQEKGRIPYKHFNYMKVRYSWSE